MIYNFSNLLTEVSLVIPVDELYKENGNVYCICVVVHPCPLSVRTLLSVCIALLTTFTLLCMFLCLPINKVVSSFHRILIIMFYSMLYMNYVHGLFSFIYNLI